jgi:hypothetical protein
MVMTINTYKIESEASLTTAKAAINALSNFKASGTFKIGKSDYMYVITEA